MSDLTVVTHNGEDLVVPLPIKARITALAEACSDKENLEGLEVCERLAKRLSTVTVATLEDARTLRDQAHTAHKAIEDLRKDAKDPFTQGGKAVDAISKDMLHRLLAVKQKMADAVAACEAQIEADRKAALQTACAAAAEGRIDVAATDTVNELAGHKGATFRWQWKVLDAVKLALEAPEYTMPDASKLTLIGQQTPKDREPKAIPGILWVKKYSSRSQTIGDEE